MIEIYLGRGMKCQVSDKDFDLCLLNWHLTRIDGYACRDEKRKHILLHLIVAERMGITKTVIADEVDHIDQNKLNNQRFNLRLATKSQNLANSKIRKDNILNLKCVQYYSKNNKYGARIQIDGKRIFLGLYNTKEEAQQAYDEAARKYFGEFAYLNEASNG